MPEIRTGFTPDQHGFQFANSFRLLQGISLPMLGQISYGLCGGMVHAALDYYDAGKAVPAGSEEPQLGGRLHRLLVRRQLASLWPPSVTMQMLSWMRKDDGELALLTAAECAPLFQQLDALRPVVLMVARAHRDENPVNNHQILATGYDLNASSGSVTIYVYDPNYPCHDPYLSLDLSDPVAGLGLEQSTGDLVRGFFVGWHRSQTIGL